jgi:hypothetical protein
VAGFSALTAALTYPLAFNLRTLGYKLQVPGDSQYSVWNVAWVAHALLENPLKVFDANIFYPHRWTLIYSEANLLAGALGAPVQWLLDNAYATHNFVLLLSFVLSALGTYYLVRYLTGDRRAAVIGAVCFAYCPYVFGHLPHIQLLMTAGIPFSLLAFHRLVDRPTASRGVALGAAMGAQGLACAYYAVFVALLIGLSVIVSASWLGLWRDRAYWKSISVAALVATAIVAPLFIPYVLLQRDTGFRRALDDAGPYSANWASYLTSAAYSSSWIHPFLPKWNDVLFPGFIPLLFGLGGILGGWARGGRDRYLTVLYVTIGTWAFWESFGPSGGLYTATYYAVPAFTFLRAPSRFGVIVTLVLSILAATTISRWLAYARAPRVLALALTGCAIVARVAPIPLTPNPELPPVYYELAKQPDGAVVEFPLYSHRSNFYRTQYMLASTVHWKPLVNAYSDVIPQAFSASRDALSMFPTREAFKILEADRVRYTVFHLVEYHHDLDLRQRLEEGLQEFAPYLRKVYGDKTILLYEILGYPE